MSSVCSSKSSNSLAQICIRRDSRLPTEQSATLAEQAQLEDLKVRYLALQKAFQESIKLLEKALCPNKTPSQIK